MLKLRLNSTKCGNSSVVEHNLAMVGVASSTLVSRSIFLLLFIFLNQLFAITLTNIVAEKIKRENPNILIEHLELVQPSSLPDDFGEYKLKDVQISNLNGAGGAIKAVYLTPKGSLRPITVRFNMSAKIAVFIATQDLPRDHALSEGDYAREYIDFREYSSDALSEISAPLVAKTRVKQGEVLKSRQFARQKDVRKGDAIVVVVTEGAVSAEALGVAGQDGSVGDVINVKIGSQTLRAQIVSKNRAIVR